LDADISHQQAISILQQARGLVELVIARPAADPSISPDPTVVTPVTPLPSPLPSQAAASPPVARSPSATSDTSKAGSDMVVSNQSSYPSVVFIYFGLRVSHSIKQLTAK
jgi:multiple PDZ domain protein